MDAAHLVWIGFSFADQRITAILREIAEASGTRVNPGGAPRHVAVMAWDPARGQRPGHLGPAGGDRVRGAGRALPGARWRSFRAGRLLSELTDPRFPPAMTRPPGPCR